jgi:hypothetical protein
VKKQKTANQKLNHSFNAVGKVTQASKGNILQYVDTYVCTYTKKVKITHHLCKTMCYNIMPSTYGHDQFEDGVKYH